MRRATIDSALRMVIEQLSPPAWQAGGLFVGQLAYSGLICTLRNLTTPEPYWSASDPPKCLLSCVGGFFTVQHDNKMRTMRRDFMDIPFAVGLRHRIDLLRVLHRGNETG